MRKLRSREAVEGYLFISPWLIGFTVFALGPLVASILISFSGWDLISRPKFVGAANYVEIAGDPLILKALYNTFFYAAFSVPLGLVLALFLALMLNRRMAGVNIYRTVFYLPAITSGVAICLLWKLLFNSDSGLINEVLRHGGAGIYWIVVKLHEGIQAISPRLSLAALVRLGPPEPPGWLADPRWSKPALILMSVWSIGAPMIIFLAGLQGIPQELYEAAEIDGAGAASKFRHVTLPMLSPVIFFNAVVGIIGAFQVFVQVYIMTGPSPGGPENSTLLYVVYLFKQAFEYLHFGYAAAMAWLLFAIILGLTLVQFALGRRWVHYER